MPLEDELNELKDKYLEETAQYNMMIVPVWELQAALAKQNKALNEATNDLSKTKLQETIGKLERSLTESKQLLETESAKKLCAMMKSDLNRIQSLEKQLYGTTDLNSPSVFIQKHNK